MFDSSTIELSSEALRNNIRFIKRNMKNNVRLCSVVKGNAYGHGLSQFVEMCMKEEVDYFAVHAIEEAYILKTQLTKVPDLFIMGAIEDEQLDWAIQNQIEFSVFDLERLNAAVSSAKRLNVPAKVHIEIETGMRRTGFEENLIPKLFSILLENQNHIVLQGLFTHFAGAENKANDFRITEQILVFKNVMQQFESKNLKPNYIHTACSAALLNYPDAPGNMVRIGILQYGFWPNAETHIRYCEDTDKSPDLLKRIIRWTTKVMAIKEVKKGSFVGYGTSYFAHKKMKLAIVPVGYSHGYSRNLSNIGSVLIQGKIAPVVGIVNMNSLTVDVSAIENVKRGEEVVFIGKQNGKVLTVNSFSEQSNQLNYELLTRLPINIPRIIK